MRIPNVLSLAAMWWRLVDKEIHLTGVVRVEHRHGETWISVEDTIPHLTVRGVRAARYRITTTPFFLSPGAFRNRELRHAIATDARKPRRRALFCQELRSDEVLAAVSFHVDDSRQAPIVLTDIAVRQDHPVSNAWSRYAVHILIGYLLQVAKQDGRPSHVGFLARNDQERELATRLGLKPCRRPRSVRGDGIYMCFAPVR
jgi:hypothetical protein